MPTYSLLDFSDKKRLEQWGEFCLIRPDPTADGPMSAPELWKNVDAEFIGEKGKGEWKKNRDLPEHWPVHFDDLTLLARLAPYKHTGIFPEQSENWQWMRVEAKKVSRPLTVLNLFAYTGGATSALSKDGHHVTHVDSAKPSIGWAKENALLNGIAQDKTRWILDDAQTFVTRELKRQKSYDGIILDPPAFGHSPTGKTWRVERDLKPLLEDCVALLSEKPSFMVLNGYAQNAEPESYARLLTAILKFKRPELHAKITAHDLTLHAEDGRELSTGSTVRCGFERE
jgi:23S rRNA (cytosine1962-C5)-methyltransferase